MIKYIKVEWPEIQDFMHHPRWNECIFCTEIEGHPCSDNTYMVPEDLYDEITNPHYQLPEEYSNFTMEFDKIKGGQNCLIVTVGGTYKVVKSMVNYNIYDSLPIIFEQGDLIEGINCKLIAIEK